MFQSHLYNAFNIKCSKHEQSVHSGFSIANLTSQSIHHQAKRQSTKHRTISLAQFKLFVHMKDDVLCRHWDTGEVQMLVYIKKQFSK